MNTMEELKSVVMKTLESQGILGEIRAKLRTNVFKIIDQQDSTVKTSAGFYLENPMAAKLMENPDILLCAELIREFLEFYKMDFTLQVFVPECNLPLNDKVRDKLENKLGVKKAEPALPALMQVLQAFKQGGGSSAIKENFAMPVEEKKSGNEMSTTKYGGFGLDEPFTNRKKEEPFDVQKKPQAAEAPARIKAPEPPKDDTALSKPKTAPAKDEVPSKTNNPLTQPLPPLKGGPKLGPLPPLEKKSELAPAKKEPVEEKKVEKPVAEPKPEPKKDLERPEPDEETSEKEKNHLREVDEKLEKLTAGIKIDKKPQIAQLVPNPPRLMQDKPEVVEDNYEQDKFEEIEEDIIAGESDRENTFEEQHNKNQRMFTDSGGFTASASLGIDPSVDSLALEDYDYIEPVEKSSAA